MSMTALLGLSFGVFPCLLFGFIMLISLLVCEYIEEYVAKHLCAWKNRRRRGLRNFYRDFRDRRNSPHTHDAAQHYSSRSRCYPPSQTSRVGGNVAIDPANSGYLSLGDGNLPLSPSAPPSERLALLGAQVSGYSSNYQLVPVDDAPPSYEECVLPRVRLQNSNNGRHGNGARSSKNKTSSSTTQPKKPSSKAPSSPEQKKDKENY